MLRIPCCTSTYTQEFILFETGRRRRRGGSSKSTFRSVRSDDIHQHTNALTIQKKIHTCKCWHVCKYLQIVMAQFTSLNITMNDVAEMKISFIPIHFHANSPDSIRRMCVCGSRIRWCGWCRCVGLRKLIVFRKLTARIRCSGGARLTTGTSNAAWIILLLSKH